MPKIIMLKGLPASGKSTWAKEQVVGSNGRVKRVNKDDLRSMLDASIYGKMNEGFVLLIRDHIIRAALANGFDVIVDDTNFNPFHQKSLEDAAKEMGAEFEVKFFDTPVEECIERDAKRENSVGEKVIRDMYSKYLPQTSSLYEPDPNLPKAIIVDMDGTLAKMNGRSPYDWSRVGEDTLNEPIAHIVKSYYEQGVNILVVSGRDDSCRLETHNWLNKNGIVYYKLFMRPAGSTEKDNIIKQRIFEENIKDKYNILFVLDDRDSVVQYWRSIGLTCLQVDYGNF